MFKYFKELLSTLKKIERHLESIAKCVSYAGKGSSGRAIQIKDTGKFGQ